MLVCISIFLICYLSLTANTSYNSQIEERGRAQYQLIQEKGNLPQYGTCWKSGIQYLERGCKLLTDEIQSEIALHFTNCFLSMSGHDTYNCGLDKKANVRAICINSMSDRAFNVYTEFYTHTQNICAFLQGHVWQEIIAENTILVGHQLKETAQNQEGLLAAQKESLKLQEKMLHHGKVLENILEDLFRQHGDNLNVLLSTISNFQSWIVREMSWFDSVIFYTVSVVLSFICTSSSRTSASRLIIFFLQFLNFLSERIICSIYIFISDKDTSNLYSKVYSYIWFSRYVFISISVFLLVYFAVNHKSYVQQQFEILLSIQKQNSNILKILQNHPKPLNLNPEVVDKTYLNSINENIKAMNNSLGDLKSSKDLSNKSQKELPNDIDNTDKNYDLLNLSIRTLTRKRHILISDNSVNKQLKDSNVSFDEKYNLRSNRCAKSEPRQI
ncbi:uncharacterized protein LOC126882222 [Diabrotica virgifera virgifera]|uniref:Uncharacterized protein LOC114340273 n=1 Tax=Diabrotica virgifera virgifera TaxID=50390 RepID=A0A6P7GSL4_DIAVI|nr:uncharacterized protein LOC126882222 [Diabrotica virgifera virgifera]XP_050502987.1 uncharacterized protein LOC126882222 [Diabrotica virgifera virgifera]